MMQRRTESDIITTFHTDIHTLNSHIINQHQRKQALDLNRSIHNPSKNRKTTVTHIAQHDAGSRDRA